MNELRVAALTNLSLSLFSLSLLRVRALSLFLSLSLSLFPPVFLSPSLTTLAILFFTKDPSMVADVWDCSMNPDTSVNTCDKVGVDPDIGSV